MVRRGSSDGRNRSATGNGRPCAGCGRLIKTGLYCVQCLEKFRERAKVQGERMEALKTNAMKKVAEGSSEIVILIVNNDERNLSITKIVLERGLTDYKVLATSNSLTAVNTLVSRDVSLVLLDADYNGLEMLGRIREDERFKDLPVMMMSGSTQREVVANVFSLGVQDYVTKPCAPQDLVNRVRKLLDPNFKAPPAPRPAPRPAPAAQEPRQRSTFQILLVEDDMLDLRQERTRIQNRIPCEIFTAQSAAEGMRVLENRAVDLILVNLDMPFVNGLRFVALVKNNSKLQNIPVIIMTDTRDFTVLSEIERSAAAGHVRKPNIPEDGLRLIESKLRERR